MASQGLVKTREAIAALEAKFLFDLGVKPALLSPPAGASSLTNTDIRTFFSIPKGWIPAGPTSTKSQHTVLSDIAVQWGAHCRAWRAPEEGKPRPTPGDVYDYWLSLEKAAPELSALALYHWSSPVSNASPERVFRILSHMDDPLRRTMKHLSLFNQLYLRVNSAILRQLAGELVADIAESKQVVSARHGAKASAAGKRHRDSGVEEAASKATVDAMDVLRSGKSQRPPRKKWLLQGPMSDGEEDEVEAVLVAMNKEAAAAGVGYIASLSAAAAASGFMLGDDAEAEMSD